MKKMHTNYNLVENLVEIFNKGVTVFLSNGSLKVKDSSKVLSKDEVNNLKENKNDIISFFSNQDISSNSQIGPLSLQQQRLWLIEKIDTGKAQYNLPGILDLTGELNVVAIEKAIRTIVNRHDVLRSIYYEEADKVYQLVRDVSDNKIINFVDHSYLSDDQQTEPLEKITNSESRRVFDLSEELPLHAVLIKKSSNQFTLLLTMHHICADAWSADILLNELASLYSSYVNGGENLLTELPIQYIDYADWQRDWLKKETVNDDLDYWQQRLSGLPQVHSLRLDKPRPNIQDVDAGHYWLDVDSALQSTINAFCKTYKVTPFILLQTVFACLLQRYSGQDDIVMGTPIANRERSELSGLIGFFVNTLTLRTDLSEGSSFEDLLHKNKTEILDNFEHQSLPFELLVERLKPERSLSFTPIFQVMFAFQSHERKDLHLPGLAACSPKQGYTASKFDLTFEVIQNQDGMLLHWEYASSIFVQKTIEKMASHYLILLKASMETPKSDIASLTLLSEADKQQLLTQWNNTAFSYSKDKCFHHLFEEQVEQTPDAVAVVFKEEQLTYEVLNHRANRLAHYLISEKKITPDTMVGICVKRSLDMLIGLLAILKAGGAYVPLDPDYPEARLEYMLSDAKLNTVLTQSDLLNATPVSDTQAVCLDHVGLQKTLKEQNKSNPSVTLNSSHLAYVIYTSGSTGNPKGVMIEHKNAVNFLTTMGDQPGISSTDTLLAVTSISFDIHVLELYLPLINGAKLIVASTESTMDPQALLNLIDEHHVSVMQATPATWKMLVDTDWKPKSDIKVLCGGEALSYSLAMDLLSRNKLELWNMYGPTETTVWSTTKQIRPNDESILMGKPIGNTQIYITTNDLSLSPVGVAGELHIAGDGLARGYLNQKVMTAEKFVENPFYNEREVSSSQRLYKTGDLVRYLPDGDIEYLGRIDHQVKIRGFRVELGEIENALIGCNEVKDTVVVAKNDQSENKYIAAYVVINGGDEGSDVAEQIRHELRQSLPDYMLPSAFVFMDALPLTPNGKVDRKALPEPDVSGQQEVYVAPSTYIEKALCTIWQEVLGVEQVGVNDNFFHLGGHSLLVMQVISQAQQKDIHFAARQVFAHSTLAGLAADIDGSSIELFVAPENLIPEGCTEIEIGMLPLVTGVTQQELDQCIIKIKGGVKNVQDIYPLAPLQEGILFHHMMSDEIDPYIMPVLFAIEGRVAFNEFVDGLQFIIDRHDIMRTAIIWKDMQQALQVVCREARLLITELELDPSEGVEPQMRARSAEIQPIINLEEGSLLRVEFAVEQATGRYFVLVQIHHIISDHVVLEIIQRELDMYRAGNANGLTKSVPYREFVAHTQHQSKEYDAQAFFTSMLAEVHEPTVPFDLFDTNGDGSRIVELKADVDAEVAAQLRSLARSLKVSPAAIFHTCWAVVVSACSGKGDVVFGTVMSGRLQGTKDAESMLGVFINTLPLRVQLDNEGVLSVIKQVHKSLMNLLPFEQASLAVAQSCSSVSGDAPLFSSLFNYRHSDLPMGQEATGQEGREVSVIFAQERSNYPFNLSVDDWNGEGFSVEVQVDQSVNAERVVEYVQTALSGLVDALVSKPESEIKSLNILPWQEQNKILIDWNDTAVDFPKDQPIHTLFETQAAKTPDDVAVMFEDQSLTYVELNEKSNQLAHYLINEKKITPDTMVGICTERSLDMVVGLLAILKAGGAYVPLDPDYPEARLEYMLGDAKLKTVLTQSNLRNVTPVSDEQAVCFDDNGLQQILKENPQSNPDVALKSNHLAYVIYTSGSTGNPKGVMIEHGNAVNFLTTMGDKPGIRSTDTLLAVTSISFDIHVLELYLPLVNGAKLIVASTESTMDAQALLSIMEEHQVSVMQATPATWKMLVDTDWSSEMSIKVLCGGEALSHALAMSLLARPNLELWNMYGPTETTVWSTTKQIKHDHDAILMGKPIGNTQIYITTNDLSLSPVGVAGELHIAGDGLARGYLNQEALTAEKFINNPFYDESNALSSQRLYKTGDLVRYLPDGDIEYLGRMDDQIKVRGFRIELGEIENALIGFNEVKDSVVIAKDDQAGNKYIVAYVVAKSSCEATSLIEDIRRYLSQSLPDYMVPSAFVFLDVLPLTPNGKVDRKALPEPDVLGHQQKYIAPATKVEKILSTIWEDVLGVEKIGINDNFFYLGGDSLIVMSVVVKIREHGISIQPKDIISYKTIKRIAEQIKKAPTSVSSQDDFFDNGIISVTPWQLNLLNKYNEKRMNQYNMNHLSKLNFTADTKILTQAFKHVVSTHGALRCSFKRKEVTFHAEIKEHLNDEVIDFIDLTGFDEAERKKIAVEHHEKTKESYINISNGTLIHLSLWRFGGSEGDQLLITVSHLVADVYSLKLIFDDLISAYEQIELGAKVTLAKVSASPIFAAQKINEFSLSSELKNEVDYWSSIPLNKIPVFKPDFNDVIKEEVRFGQKYIWNKYSKEFTQELIAHLSQFEGSSIEDLLIFLAVEVQKKWLGGQYFRVNVVNSGRAILDDEFYVDLSRTVGYYNLTKLLFLESCYDGHVLNGLEKMISQIKSVPTKGVGIRYLLNDDGDQKINAKLQPLKEYLLTQKVFSLQYFGVIDGAVIAIKPDDDNAGNNIYRISMEAQIKEGSLQIRWSYNENLYTEKTMALLAEFSDDLMQKIAAQLISSTVT